MRSLLGAPSTNSNRRGDAAAGTAVAASATGAASLSSSTGAARDALRSLGESRRRQQFARAAGLGVSSRSRAGIPDAALDTASLMMRGISEEEQIAMAIAASLQEQNNDNGNDSEGGSESSSSSPSSEESSNNSGESSEESESSSSSNAGAAGLALPSADEHSTSQSSVAAALDASDREGAGNTISDLARVVTDSGRDGDFAAAIAESEALAASNRSDSSNPSQCNAA